MPLISEGHLRDLIGGRKRTRRSTLARIVAVLVDANPEIGPIEAVTDRLCRLAGPTLAPESEYPERVARTLRRRARRRELGTWIP